MRSFKFTTAFLLLVFLSIGIISCSNDDNDPDQSRDQTIDRIESNLTDGNWRITKFIDSDDDETNHFNGYNFTFNTNGVLIANNGTNTYQGSWSITDSDSSDDDDSSDDLDFNINFNLSNDFEDLNDDWDIISQSSSKIELIDISGGNGETDYLTFEKN